VKEKVIPIIYPLTALYHR